MTCAWAPCLYVQRSGEVQADCISWTCPAQRVHVALKSIVEQPALLLSPHACNLERFTALDEQGPHDVASS